MTAVAIHQPKQATVLSMVQTLYFDHSKSTPPVYMLKCGEPESGCWTDGSGSERRLRGAVQPNGHVDGADPG